MARHVLYTLFAVMFFIKQANPAADPRLTTENLYNQQHYGKLQAHLYTELDDMSKQQSRNSSWAFVTTKAFEDFSPIMLYFIFRTIFNLPTDQRCYQSIETAWLSVMVFKILAYIDADICATFNFGGYPKWIFDEFSKKLTKRISTFNGSIRIPDQFGPSTQISFNRTFEVATQMLSVYDFSGNNPAWISLCTKPKSSYIGLWSDTINFGDLSQPARFKFEDNKYDINSRRGQLLQCIIDKIKLLKMDRTKSDSELWNAFLAIKLDC